MHHYRRNIGDYAKKAGRLSMLQDGAYNRLIDCCYDREQFPTMDEALDWAWASTEAEVEAVKFILSKFFVLQPDGTYVQKRIFEELLEFWALCEMQAIKGKKGGRPKKANGKENKPGGFSEKPSGKPAVSRRGQKESLPSNHYPPTTNQEVINPLVQSPPAESLNAEPVAEYATVITMPTNKFNTNGEVFRVTEDLLPDWQAAYPLVDIPLALAQAKVWLQDNPTKRKTIRGMRKFLGSWLERRQNRGIANGNTQNTTGQPGNQGRLSGAERTRRARDAAFEREQSLAGTSDVGCVGAN